MSRVLRLLAPELSLVGLWFRSPVVPQPQASAPAASSPRPHPAVAPGAYGASAASPAPSSAATTRDGRNAAWARGLRALMKLQGAGMRNVESELALLRANPRRPIGDARVFVIYGPPGTGKHTLGKIVGDLLYGAGMTASTEVSLLADGGDLVPAGTWLLEDSDKFLGDEPFMDQIGRQLLHANASNPLSVSLVLIGSERMTDLLPPWVGKLETCAWPLSALTTPELLTIARGRLAEAGMQITSAALAALGRRLEKPNDVPYLRHASRTTLLVNYLSAARNSAIRAARTTIDESDIPL